MTTHRYVYSFESLRGSIKHTQYEATHTHTRVHAASGGSGQTRATHSSIVES